MIGAIALKGIVASINLLGSTDKLTFEAEAHPKTCAEALEGCDAEPIGSRRD